MQQKINFTLFPETNRVKEMVNDIDKKNKKWKKDSLHNKPKKKQREIGGPQGPEPTRYGDWEKKGRCIDF